MAGMSSGPTPWWTTPGPGGGGAAALQRLQSNTPAGYEYDPVQQQYTRTPSSAGGRAASFTQSYLNGVPSLNGLATGASSMVNGGAAAGTGVGTGTGAPGAAGAGGGALPGPGSVSAGGGYVPAIQGPDTTAATNAQFAQAKDKAGQIARSSLDSLAGEFGRSGMLGSGAQGQATRDVVNTAAGALGSEANNEAVQRTNLTEQNALAGYQGAITQRGQDVQAQEANARLALQANQAAWQRNAELLSMALSGLGGNFGVPASGQKY